MTATIDAIAKAGANWSIEVTPRALLKLKIFPLSLPKEQPLT